MKKKKTKKSLEKRLVGKYNKYALKEAKYKQDYARKKLNKMVANDAIAQQQDPNYDSAKGDQKFNRLLRRVTRRDAKVERLKSRR